MVYAQHLKCCLHCGYGFESHLGHHMKNLSAEEKKLIFTILEKVNTAKKSGVEVRTFSFPFLWKIINAEEKKFAEKILKINPRKFGFKGKKIEIKSAPRNLVSILNQRIEKQFLPRPVFKAFKKMNSAMQNEIGTKLEILSGYRSPAYQLVVFIWNLRAQKYNLEKTIARVALPGYSEHNDAKNTGIDFICSGTKISLATTQTFAKTAQYKWLQRNARKFGFTESFPKKNKLGVIYEPWHWRYLV